MRSQPRLADSGVQFGILGALLIEADGHEVELGSSKQRLLMGALLIDSGEVVSTGRLAEILWGDDLPENAGRAIRTYVSRLRRALFEAGGAEARAMLATRPTGYALTVHPDRVDARRFEGLVQAARIATSPEVVADLVFDALALWRGEAFAEFDHDRATTESERLGELRRVAIELRADALLRLGRFQDVVAELEVAVVHSPLRERLHAQLMVALYRCSRQTEALAVYRNLRRELVSEFGVEPSAALRRIENAILQQVDDLPWPAPPIDAVTKAEAEIPRRSGTVAPSWPVELTSFVGRTADLSAVVTAMRAKRVVVLTGIGGVGKTRLALRAARELAPDYVDGVVVCDLVSAEHPDAVVDVVATMLEILPGSGGGSQNGVVEALHGQRMLLVLDNCEHVVAAVSDLVERVCRRCPHVGVLATSRRALHVSGQQVWPVAPFAVGEEYDDAAVELFRDRAVSADPAFEMTDPDRGLVLEICRRLDGLALAIELAAAQMRSMNLADIAARLDDRLDLFAKETILGSARHRSLRAVLEWSYGLLSDESRMLVDRLATFVGGFGLDDAVAVGAGDGVSPRTLPNRLIELVDHSLVEVDHSDRHARYRLLESVRALGEEHLDELDELHRWRRRHAEHFTALAEAAAHGLRGPDEARWVRTIDAEFANFRAAHSWACADGQSDLALRLPAALYDYAYYRLHDEVHAWALRAVELPDIEHHAHFPAAAVAAAVGRMQRGDLERARHDVEQVLTMAADEQVRLRAVQLLAEIALYEGRLEAADRHGRELVELARAVGDADYDEALGYLYRVHAAAYGARRDDARALLRRGQLGVDRTGAPALRAGYLYLEGEIQLDHDPGVARAALRRAIDIADATRNRFIGGIARVSIAALEARHGAPVDALAAFHDVVDHWRRCGDWVHMWTTLRNLVALFERVGASESAVVLLGALRTATTGAEAFGADATRLEHTDAVLRAVLGGAEFAALEASGRAMSDAQAVTFALDEVDRVLTEIGS